MGVLFKIHFLDQSHVTIVWNTRETGDIQESQNRGVYLSLLSEFLNFRIVILKLVVD